MKNSLNPNEVVNRILKVVTVVVTEQEGFTGKIVFEVNCKNGTIRSVNAIEQRVIEDFPV